MKQHKTNRGVFIQPSRTRSDLIRETKELLREFALQPNKNLGQNFCVEPHILDLIVTTISQLDSKNILEIGGGLGTLSEALAQLKIPLTVIEKDSNLAFLLEKKFNTVDHVKVINEDALLLKEEFINNFDIIIGNIPYEISSPILFKIWKKKNGKIVNPNIILTIQKEFALRIVAKSGTQEYGRLSAMSQIFSEPKVLKIFPPSAFYPVPKVAHGVIWLKPTENIPDIAFTKSFGDFMIGLFNRKNKKAINSLEPLLKNFKNKKIIEEKLRTKELILNRVKDIKPNECLILYENWLEIIKEADIEEGKEN